MNLVQSDFHALKLRLESFNALKLRLENFPKKMTLSWGSSVDVFFVGVCVLLAALLIWIRSAALIFIPSFILLALLKDYFSSVGPRKYLMFPWSKDFKFSGLGFYGLVGLIFIMGIYGPSLFTTEVYKRDFGERHVYWHTIWSSLGEFPNPYGFKWSDAAASIRASKVKKELTGSAAGLAFGSKEYETMLKEDVLRVAKKDPWFFWNVLKQKIAYRLPSFLASLGVVFVFTLLCFALPRLRTRGKLAEFLIYFQAQFEPIPWILLSLLAHRIVVLVSVGTPRFYYPTWMGEQLAYYSAPFLPVQILLVLFVGLIFGFHVLQKRFGQK